VVDFVPQKQYLAARDNCKAGQQIGQKQTCARRTALAQSAIRLMGNRVVRLKNEKRPPRRQVSRGRREEGDERRDAENGRRKVKKQNAEPVLLLSPNRRVSAFILFPSSWRLGGCFGFLPPTTMTDRH
jgi:hypothetical protein